MKNKSMIFTSILLAISLVVYTMISSQGFRTVEFLSVFAMGMLSGVFLVQFFHNYKRPKKKKISG